ncbi:MAG: DNA repair protein RadA [Deltaproteobacteria bacterium]|nr:DNA repair protein RadA [Deltaproteobacteria bacterium]
MRTEKKKTHFICQLCGYQSSKWMGKCPNCNEWNTLVEEEILSNATSRNTLTGIGGEGEVPQSVSEIETNEASRIKTGIGEFDRVLGGGIVFGSVILIGGDPGIGKSTLLLQALNKIASSDYKVLYISGEESIRQTKMRAERLSALSAQLFVLAENSLEKIIKEVHALKPKVIVIDSIQTMYTLELQSAPGSIGQVRESAARLIMLSKSNEISTFIIGHVTKEGAIAGPRVLEHMVDTVLYFEGDRGHPYRILRTVKNRFGSSNEIGVFEMKEFGLSEVFNPSEIFLNQRPIDVSGSVVVPCMEGSRPILVEIQALVSPTNLGIPRRTSIGVDHHRVSLLAAVLERQLDTHLYNKDIFLNVAGGVRVDEPAVDLGIVVAIASSVLNKPVDTKTVFFGEVGLTGEVRGVSQIEVRLKESSKLGFKSCILPEVNRERLHTDLPMELSGVSSVKEVLKFLS